MQGHVIVAGVFISEETLGEPLYPTVTPLPHNEKTPNPLRFEAFRSFYKS